MGIPDLYIKCLVCGRRLKAVNARHLHTHGISVADYKSAFDVDFVYSSACRIEIADRMRRRSSKQGRKRFRDEYVPLRRQSILKAIRHFYDREEVANYPAARNKIPGLVSQACTVFGNWHAAVIAAGRKPERLRVWSKERVVERLRDRKAKGEPLDWKTVRSEDPKFPPVAAYHFGSWRNALKAAGIRYAKIGWASNRTSRNRTAERLREWVAAHGPLTVQGLKSTDSGLFTLLYKHFGGPASAGRKLGLPFRLSRRVNQYSSGRREKAVEATTRDLLAWVAKHGAIDPKLMRNEDPALRSRLYRYFGTAAKAARALGVPCVTRRASASSPARSSF